MFFLFGFPRGRSTASLSGSSGPCLWRQVYKYPVLSLAAPALGVGREGVSVRHLKVSPGVPTLGLTRMMTGAFLLLPATWEVQAAGTPQGGLGGWHGVSAAGWQLRGQLTK